MTFEEFARLTAPRTTRDPAPDVPRGGPLPRRNARPAPARERLLTPGEVATLFGVPVRTVAAWAAQGRLPAVRTPGGTRRYREADVWVLLCQSAT